MIIMHVHTYLIPVVTFVYRVLYTLLVLYHSRYLINIISTDMEV